MRKFNLAFLILFCLSSALSQKPCDRPEFRQFDFWLGEWEAFGQNGKAGDSRISIIIDSCVILEEWTSANLQNGLRYQGKSFNTYNLATKQWQQTWVDNTGNTTEFLRGDASPGKIIFFADNVTGPKGEKFIRRLTFTKLENDKVRQVGERSTDNGASWTQEYDLEYRRKKN